MCWRKLFPVGKKYLPALIKHTDIAYRTTMITLPRAPGLGLSSNRQPTQRDPIFWLHHANVDRLWWNWQQSGIKNSTSSRRSSIVNPFTDYRGRTNEGVRVRITDMVNPFGLTINQKQHTESEHLTCTVSGNLPVCHHQHSDPKVFLRKVPDWKNGTIIECPVLRWVSYSNVYYSTS